MRHAWSLLLALGAVATSRSASAQGTRGAHIGPFLGVVGTGATGFQLAYRASMSAGVQWDQVFGPLFFRLGAFYAGRGAQQTPVGGDGALEERYLEFPFLLGYQPPTEGRTRVFIVAGGQLGIQTSCTSQGAGCRPSDSNALDDGVVVGSGLSLPLGKADLMLEVRVVQGVHESSYGKSQSITFGAAYMLPLAHHQ